MTGGDEIRFTPEMVKEATEKKYNVRFVDAMPRREWHVYIKDGKVCGHAYVDGDCKIGVGEWLIVE